MHKVEALEKKWFDYRLRKVLSGMMKFALLYMILAISYYFYTTGVNGFFSMTNQERMTNVLGVSMDADNSIKEKNATTITSIEQPVEEPLTKEPLKENPKVLHEMALVPIIPVIDLAKEERISEVKRARPSTPKMASNLVSAKRNTYLTAKELAVISKPEQRVEHVPHKTKKINFQSTSVNYIDTMKAKFAKSKNSRDALLLAKAYYKEGKYQESEQWALSANKLDNNLEESWLLFAKAKAKLGKKEEAVTILASYYKKSHSTKAKSLMGQIKTGKI